MKLNLCLAFISLLMLACSTSAYTPQSSIMASMDTKPAQLSTPDALVCTVTASKTLNLRQSPGTDAAVIAVLDHGDQLTILSDPAQGMWIPVRAGNLTGWINSKYCKGK